MPLGPTRLTMPGPSSTPACARRRSGLASTAVTSTGRTSHVETDRHHQIAEVFVVDRLQQARPQRRDQPQHDLIALDAFDPLAEEVGVEADLQRLALEGGGHRLLRVADVWGRRGPGQVPPRKRKPQTGAG